MIFMFRSALVLLLLPLFVVPCFGQNFGGYIDAKERAAAIAASLDDRLLAGQVIMTGIDGKARLSADMKLILGQCPPGAIMLFRYNLDTPKNEVKNFLDECREFITLETGGAGIPPFIAVDHEGGTVHRFGPGVTRLPAAAFWAGGVKSMGREGVLAALEEASFQSGKEIRDLGITLNLAPVAETLNSDNRRFLGERSFGAESRFTADAAAAFIRGMDRAGIGCTLKHFPGNTGVDPHEASAVLRKNREELAEMATPFASLIKNEKVSAVMVSHVLVPAWDSENIGSLSPAVIGDWLRGELGFTGIVLADDFSMAAAVNTPRASSRLRPEAAAVRSLAAGADMVMAWPSNVRKIHSAILAALADGSLPRARLREAAARIILEKIRLGLIP
ncbi:glycoside hydrolase family 3 [Spirochaetia bacterium]|nr:glycoside hydrolase family 3 [Spirochaetia bacterium]